MSSADDEGPDWEAFDDDPATTDLTLGDVLRAAAEGLGGVATTELPEADDPTADSAPNPEPSTTWSVGGRPVAVLQGERAEFRLDPVVARAALRTPDTAASSRGGDWVAFAPVSLDDAAVDRAEAWFLSAVRRAGRASNR